MDLELYIYFYIGLGMLMGEKSQYVDMSDVGGGGKEGEIAGITCRARV